MLERKWLPKTFLPASCFYEHSIKYSTLYGTHYFENKNGISPSRGKSVVTRYLQDKAG